MPDPTDLGFDLIPPDPGLLSPDLALDAALQPVVDIANPEPRPLGRGWAFDFVNGRFFRAGSAPARVYDTDHLRVWIEKVLRTAAHAHPIYTDLFGLPDPFVLIGETADGTLIGGWQDAVVAALTTHDRIAGVDGFGYQHDPADDGLFVTFSVTLDDQTSVDVGPVQLGGAQ